VATMPCFEMTIERACDRSCENILDVKRRPEIAARKARRAMEALMITRRNRPF
jgi:hypothetical protein